MVDALQQLVNDKNKEDEKSVVLGSEVKDITSPILLQTEESGENKFVVIRVNKESQTPDNSLELKDLVALLKNLESEVNLCETTLNEENDKRKKYKIDDCRRTHNYDEFIRTFLFMLAEQGKLADLVQPTVILPKKAMPVKVVSKLKRQDKVGKKKVKGRRKK